MPRRSRRSFRHLRVSGQRHRRYRDRRYPVQSPMPLTIACASPELAFGKVWVRYPVARPQDQQVGGQHEQEMVQQQTVSVAIESQVVAAAVEYIVGTPAPVEAVQLKVIATGPQSAAVETTQIETTHSEVIATLVEEQLQIIATSDTPVIKEIAAEIEPVVDVVTAPVVEEPVEAVIPQPEVVEEITEAMETTLIVEEVAAPKNVVVTSVVETEVVKAEVVATSADVECLHSHTAAPMARAPAPKCVPEAPRYSNWQRPAFAFEDKGAVGGRSTTYQATAPATHPQPVE